MKEPNPKNQSRISKSTEKIHNTWLKIVTCLPAQSPILTIIHNEPFMSVSLGCEKPSQPSNDARNQRGRECSHWLVIRPVQSSGMGPKQAPISIQSAASNGKSSHANHVNSLCGRPRKINPACKPPLPLEAGSHPMSRASLP